MNNKWPWLARNIWIPILGLGGGVISTVACLILISPALVEVTAVIFRIKILINVEALANLKYLNIFMLSFGCVTLSTLLFFLNDYLNPDSPEFKNLSNS